MSKLKFFNINKSSPGTDILGGTFFLIIGWFIFYVKPSEDMHLSEKGRFILIFEWIAETIGTLNFLLIMNALGLVLMIKGVKKLVR